MNYMLGLLCSGQAREGDRVTVEGRDGIEILSDAGDTTLVVDAHTHEPIAYSHRERAGSTVRVHIERFERLPATEANLALLSLRAQHPDAAIDATGTVEGYGGPKEQPK